MIAYIPQDPFLFQDSIIDNIKYGSKNVKDSEVWKALSLVKLDQFIKKLPDSINTKIGLLGKTLSGGQRQRLILARAILKKSEVLILDEATSEVDEKTENLIQKSLKLIKNRNKKITIIFISHRLSSLMKAEHVIELSNGIKYEGKPK